MRPPCRLAAILLVVASGCTDTSGARGADGSTGGDEFTVGTLDFHVSSGTARIAGGVLAFYLTDQPDACLAITSAPILSTVVLSLKVVAQVDGTTMASVAAPRTTPLPGQASGNLVQQVGGATTKSYDAASGSISWSLNSDGRYSIPAIDVGFADVSGRVTLAGLTVGVCP
jgi:hypothetical protein